MNPTEYIGRKMRLPKLQEKPAIIIAVFGSSRRGKAALELLEKRVTEKYSGFEIQWAYTSAIIRKKTGNPSLHQALANVVSAGFHKAVVLPVQIFPGSEYQEIYETASNFSGLRVVVGETLMHRWEFVKEVLSVVERDFIAADEGLNLLALHGTPMTADSANCAYLGLERFVQDKYDNVMAAALEGIPAYEAVLQKIVKENRADIPKRVRIIPLMFIAGLHVEDDLMGDESSWKTDLVDMGFEVECLTTQISGQRYFKSLASSPEILELFMQRLARSLELMNYR